jgi:hypothetical protein
LRHPDRRLQRKRVQVPTSVETAGIEDSTCLAGMCSRLTNANAIDLHKKLMPIARQCMRCHVKAGISKKWYGFA